MSAYPVVQGATALDERVDRTSMVGSAAYDERALPLCVACHTPIGTAGPPFTLAACGP